MVCVSKSRSWRALGTAMAITAASCASDAAMTAQRTQSSGLAEVLYEEIPWQSANSWPDNTRWGRNMRKVARDGDAVFSYYVDNSGYCQINPERPWVPDCDVTGSAGWSYITPLVRRGVNGTWAALDGMRFKTVRPGNLVVDASNHCVHMFV